MSKLGRFLSLTGKRKILLLQALFLLPFCQCCVRLLPFRYVMKIFKLSPCSTTATSSVPNPQPIYDIAWAVHTIQRHFPFIPARCLAEALTARFLLRRQQIVSHLFLGAKLQQDKTMTAHAWLRCHDITVTGSTEMANHQQVAVFT